MYKESPFQQERCEYFHVNQGVRLNVSPKLPIPPATVEAPLPQSSIWIKGVLANPVVVGLLGIETWEKNKWTITKKRDKVPVNSCVLSHYFINFGYRRLFIEFVLAFFSNSSSISTRKGSSNKSRWWLNHSIWNICSSNWIISPKIRVKIKESLKKTT